MANDVLSLPITGIYAGLLAFLLVGLSLRVTFHRRTLRVGLGDGDEVSLTRLIRAHGNFVEYVPIALVLLALAELNGLPALFLHGVALVFLVGRLMHASALSLSASNPLLRVGGMQLTLWPLIALGGALIVTSVSNYLN